MEKILTYKGNALMRSGNTIFYGKPENKHIIMIKILESKELSDLRMATKLNIELQLNDPDIHASDRVLKTAQRTNLYDALDIASIWLARAGQNK